MGDARTLGMPLQAAGQFALVSGYAIVAGYFAYKLDQPMLIAAAGLAPLAAYLAWSQPFIVCALFIAFSYFRLPEAYPFLVPLKPALLLGMGSTALVACKVLLSKDREAHDTRTLRALCLLSLLGTVGIAFPYGIIRGDGAGPLDALVIPVTMLLAAICALSWAKLLSSTAEVPLPINVRIYVAYFTFLTIATIFAVVASNSYDWWINLMWKVATMTLATAWLARSESDLKSASNIFILSGVLIALVVIYNKIHGISLVQGTRVSIGRIVSDDPDAPIVLGQILSDPNDLSLILMFPMAFALARIVHRRNLFEAAMAAAACSLMMSGIIFTQSRGAAIGVATTVAMLLLQRFKSAAPAVIALVVAAPLLFGAMNIANRDSGGYAEAAQGDLDESAQHRLDAWKTAINMAVARPIAGVGIGNFQQLYYSYTDYWFNREIAVHSMWFQVLAECGFVGFGLFVAMIWTSFTVNAASVRLLTSVNGPVFLRATGSGLQAALAGTCASGTFLSQGHTWPVYVIVAMIGALSNQAHRIAAQRGAVKP